MENEIKTCKENRNKVSLQNRFIMLFLIIIFMIGISGCMNLPQSEASIQKELLAHLSQKYNGQEFIPLFMEFNATAILNCYPKDSDPEADRVWVETMANLSAKDLALLSALMCCDEVVDSMLPSDKTASTRCQIIFCLK